MDFRKWLLVLAVLALAVAPVSAQTCSAAAGTNTWLRGEGLAELTGDVVVDCTGGAVGTTALPNITVNFNTYVTSKLVGSPNITEALLIIDDAGGPSFANNAAGAPIATPAPVVGNTVFQGAMFTNPGFILSWPGVPVTVPGPGSTRRFRFTNLRVDANPLLATTSTFAIGQVTATVAFTGNQPFTMINPTAIVGQVVAGMAVGLRNGGNTKAASVTTFQQCVDNQGSLASSSSGTGSAYDFQIQYTENFPSAFKPIGGPGQTVVNTQYFTESGLLGSFVTGGTYSVPTGSTAAAVAASIGQATQGTRLFAKFAGIPAGVAIYVSARNTNNPSVSVSNTVDASWVGQDQTAAGPVSSFPVSSGIQGLIGTAGLAPVTLTAAGDGTYTGTAVWEITAANGNAVEAPAFGVVVAYKANTASNLPGLTVTNAATKAATVGGGFAPTSTVISAVASPVPRFVDTSSQQSLFNIAACVTNLLFPFVTNQAGFDTGIALVNTSQGSPAFTNATQHGTCTLYYFGQMAGGGALPAAQTTADIPAGNYVAFSLNGGGVPAATSSAQGFQGYVIARCAFQYAHGYAFISNLGVAAGNNANFAQGYIALVIPDRAREASAFDLGTTAAGQGEILGF